MQQPILAFLSDLIFSTKISSTAKALGVEVHVVRTLDALRQRLEADPVTLLLIDLNATGDDPVEAIRVARRMTPPPRTIAYLSHVQTELAEQARRTGADEVIPRSAFVARLPDLLRAPSAHTDPA